MFSINSSTGEIGRITGGPREEQLKLQSQNTALGPTSTPEYYSAITKKNYEDETEIWKILMRNVK